MALYLRYPVIPHSGTMCEGGALPPEASPWRRGDTSSTIARGLLTALAYGASVVAHLPWRAVPGKSKSAPRNDET
ncbi:MAG: hypothetical protein FJZ86_06120 [Chloroflexi bacterium]|nr:hypothetical protein [Chloroflexota bacterium]